MNGKINTYNTFEEIYSILNEHLRKNTIVQGRVQGIPDKSIKEVLGSLGLEGRLDGAKENKIACVVGLETDNKSYFFTAGIIRPDCPEHQSDDYDSIGALAKGVHAYLVQNNYYLGAKITPFLYTVEEEVKVEEDEKAELRTLFDELESDQDLTPKEKKELGSAFRNFLDKDILSRGLSREERAEFERTYSQLNQNW